MFTAYIKYLALANFKSNSMKNKLFLIAFVCSLSASAQFTFSVNPGVQLNSATFGYRTGKFVPYIGLQLFGGKGEMVDKGKENDSNTGEIVDYTRTYSGKLSLLVPTIGTKYFFLEKAKLKAYGNLSISKPIIMGKFESSEDPNANDQFEEYRKNTSLIGGQIGFGMEYFLDENFSLGGEFGLMVLSGKNKYEYTGYVTDPNNGNSIEVTNTTDFSLRLNPTYSKISLNFYF